jgi:small subunit ribosomal protein S16
MEMLGWYQPLLPNEKNGFVQQDRVQHWLKNGAEITDKAKSLVKRLAPEALKLTAS